MSFTKGRILETGRMVRTLKTCLPQSKPCRGQFGLRDKQFSRLHRRESWKNHTYVRTAEFSTNTPVVEENSKKFMKRFSLSKHMFKCRVKEIAKAGLFYIPIIILILILLR